SPQKVVASGNFPFSLYFSFNLARASSARLVTAGAHPPNSAARRDLYGCEAKIVAAKSASVMIGAVTAATACDGLRTFFGMITPPYRVFLWKGGSRSRRPGLGWPAYPPGEQNSQLSGFC